MNRKAIGVFDSGIGGLTVFQALKNKIPSERIIYLGDTARLPYGTKSPETIIRFSEENAAFLLKKSVKLIVVACNSSSSYALPVLQNSLDIPVIGVIEPGAEAAAGLSKGTVGIIGTTATVNSGAYQRAILSIKPEFKTVSRDCPLFVPLVEEGWLDTRVTRLVAEEYLNPLKKQGIDTLVLGCTHYPVLKPVISLVMGEGIHLIDSARTTAEKVLNILTNLDWLNSTPGKEVDEFYVTDFPDRFMTVGEIFLQQKIRQVTIARF